MIYLFPDKFPRIKCILSRKHFEKLKMLFGRYAPPELHSMVEYAIFSLVYRYETLFGGDGFSTYDGSGQQGALPREAFQCLADNFGVEMELFASPYQLYIPSFLFCIW